jgi:4-hydroxyacetophenone monooxygenase
VTQLATPSPVSASASWPARVESYDPAMADAFAPLPADDRPIIDALADAELVALLAAAAHVTGDLTLLEPDLVPDPMRMREPQAGYTPEQQQRARDLVLAALRRLRDEQAGVPARPSSDELHRIMEFAAGQPVTERYVPLLLEELAIDGDLRGPQWRRDEIDPDRPFSAIVIGAGMSGIAAAHRLRQAGVDVVVVDKNADVGGTWLENSYPGCRVDIQNHMYSYSFAQKHDWPYYFSPRSVLHEYFRDCAERFGLLPLIRFSTEVERCVWDEANQCWHVEVLRPDGARETLDANVVVSAVGQLNRPRLPDIAGRDTFAGPAFHSATWDHDVELAGRRVAVIGTGASACQFVPIVAEQAAELTVFQRTAPWLIPAERYRQQVAGGFQWLLAHVPFYAQWYRFWMFWRGAEGMLPAATVDPEYPPTERAVSMMNDMMREMLQLWTDALTEGDPELRAQLTPNYPPLSKRFVVDDGSYAMALRRPHVHLVTTGIESIEPTGVRTTDGTLHEVDVIIYGTGFQASQFLTPMEVVGRDEVSLHEQWAGDARAYLGVTIPNFPNFFCLYGPNTNIVVNGSIIYFSECEVHYVTECVRHLLTERLGSIAPRREVHDAYNERIDAANRLRTWGFSGVNSWYKNEFGRTAQNWPFTVLEFWEQTRVVDPDDYHSTVAVH